MRFAFPHGEVTHSPFVQPAVLPVDAAAAHSDGSTGIYARVEPVDCVQAKRAGGLWRLPWVQKLLSIRPGGKLESH
jgi:hypothetical protein